MRERQLTPTRWKYHCNIFSCCTGKAGVICQSLHCGLYTPCGSDRGRTWLVTIRSTGHAALQVCPKRLGLRPVRLRKEDLNQIDLSEFISSGAPQCIIQCWDVCRKGLTKLKYIQTFQYCWWNFWLQNCWHCCYWLPTWAVKFVLVVVGYSQVTQLF